MQRILFVLGIHSPENLSLRKGRFPHPRPFYFLWVFAQHLAREQEVKRRWLFRWAQNKAPEHPEPHRSPLPGNWERVSTAPGLQRTVRHRAGKTRMAPGKAAASQPRPGCLQPPWWKTDFLFLTFLFLTSGNSKGESCAKHYCVKRKKSIFVRCGGSKWRKLEFQEQLFCSGWMSFPDPL